MAPRHEATLVFPKLDLEEPSTRSLDILSDLVRRHTGEPAVQVYEQALSLTYRALVELPPLSSSREPGNDADVFQKVR